MSRFLYVTTYYKVANKLYKRNFKVLPKLLGKLMKFFFACDISYKANISYSVEFPHNALGVVIGHDAIIGENTKILQNVTIGGRSGLNGNPVIGNNVLIGANACVLGNIKIGDNAKIGSNAEYLMMFHQILQ